MNDAEDRLIYFDPFRRYFFRDRVFVPQMSVSDTAYEWTCSVGESVAGAKLYPIEDEL